MYKGNVWEEYKIFSFESRENRENTGGVVLLVNLQPVDKFSMNRAAIVR